MAQYPPPPQPDQQHYNPLFPGSAGAQQLIDSVQQDHLHYGNLTQPIFAKGDSSASDQGSNGHSIHRLAQELQNHAAIEEQQRQLHQNAQQIHLQGSQPASSTGSHLAQSQGQDGDQSQKPNRLRKACDSCSIRKVKCDEAGPPCRACTALDIPCTFDRPSRRRGPPNRHAEALKRRRVDEPGIGHLAADLSTPSSPTHAAQALAALSSHFANQALSAESVCPIEVLNLLIDDFFTYVHPLCPFPHEPSFREAWKRREDLNNNRFLALLASMIAALVALFPRRPRLHLKTHGQANLFPTLVDRCLKLCSVARGPGYLDSDTINVYDAATSHFLGLAAIVSLRWAQGRLYLSECLSVLQILGLRSSRLRATGIGGDGNDLVNPDQQTDNITTEIERRIFWTLLVSVKAAVQVGSALGEIPILPPTAADPNPPIPAEVDDFCIYPEHNDAQPEGLLPMVTGFNAIASIYDSYNSLATMELSCGAGAVVDWEKQANLLQQCLRKCKDTLHQLPPELVVPGISPLSGERSGLNSALPSTSFSEHLGGSFADNPLQMEQEQTPEQRRQMQHDLQKANIYGSYLATRVYLVDKYWALSAANSRLRPSSRNGLPADATSNAIAKAGLSKMAAAEVSKTTKAIETEMRQEEDGIAADLLSLIRSLSATVVEPNANALLSKFRFIERHLLYLPKERKGHLVERAAGHLAAFVHIISRLAGENRTDDDASQGLDDVVELQVWADLHDLQAKIGQEIDVLGSA